MNFVGTEKRVRIIHGKRAIRVRAIEVVLYMITLPISSDTIDSRYLEVQGTFWNYSRYPYLDISDLQNEEKINRTTTLHKWICNLTLEVRDTLKILWKRWEMEQFLLFSTIFCYPLLDFHVKAGIRFSLRDKRLFETSEVEIMSVDCNCKETSPQINGFIDLIRIRNKYTKQTSIRIF